MVSLYLFLIAADNILKKQHFEFNVKNCSLPSIKKEHPEGKTR
jgi:hypothetical protein